MPLAFVTPRDDHTQTVTLVLQVPDSEGWRSVVRGVFLLLTFEETWEQVDPSHRTVEEVVTDAETLLNSVLSQV